MLEITTTRQNPLIDPQLAVWSWEIPVYLFFGGLVAGMMVLAGMAMLRVARGDNGRDFFSMQTPLLGFVLINLGMGALFLDLTHKLYVWRLYLTFEPASPMSWACACLEPRPFRPPTAGMCACARRQAGASSTWCGRT